MPASVSNLLASAASRRAKIQEQQDQLIAFEYSLSDKTYDDFITYSKYLEQRAESSTDVSKNLSYQKAIVSARKGYVSNEIQRQNIGIIEGRGTNYSKYDKMVELYYQAIDNGDYDLAQTLNLQLDNLSVKIQNEELAKQEAAQRVAGTMAANGVKSLKQLAKKIQEGDEIVQLGDGTLVKPVNLLNKELQTTGNAKDYFGDLYSTTKTLQSLVADAYNSATDQDTVDSIESSFKDLLQGEAKFGVAVGTDGKEKKLNMQDIELAYRSAAANNPTFSLAQGVDPLTGKQRFGLKENKIDDFVWTRNDDGTYSATQARATVSSPYQTLNTKITNEGYIVSKKGEKKDGKNVRRIGTGEYLEEGKDGTSLKDRLTGLGIAVKQASDGTLDLVIPEIGQVKGTLMPDGTIRYFGGPGQFSGDGAGLYEINLLKGGTTREVAPDEASDFGNESIFGGLLSQPSERGKNYIKNLFGLSPVNDVKPVDLRNAKLEGMAQPNLRAPGGISVANDFSGVGRSVTSSLLQGASFTQGNVLKEQAERVRQAALAENARLQAAATFNLNQMPVAQKASNGAPIKQLTVSTPKAQPKITVAPAPKTIQQKSQSIIQYAVPKGNLLQGF